MQRTYCRIRKVKEEMVRLNLVGARSLEGLGALGRLGLEGLLLFVYPNFILQWIISLLGGWRRGFLLSSLVSSSITRVGVIFVFASLLPLIFTFNCCCIVINYGLEQFVYLGIACTYHFAHILFEYKLVLVILKLGV